LPVGGTPRGVGVAGWLLLSKYSPNPQTRKVGFFLVLYGVIVCG
jgi:hypothetical protein